MHLIVAIILMGLTGFPAAAQSGRTFYIDFSSGSNSNPGTKASPWKSHPYMQTGTSCSGTGSAPAYSHQSGDHFVFKGGVSWPAACFAMNLQAGGNPSAQDYYGVDQGWFSGGTFARPVFDLNFQVPSGNVVVTGGVSYVTFDNFEIVHQGITVGMSVPYTQEQAFSFNSNGYVGLVLENSYLHDWGAANPITVQSLNYSAGAVLGNFTVISTEISDANGYQTINGTQQPAKFGGAVQAVVANTKSEVKNSKIHDAMAACFEVRSCHDNEFYNISQPPGDTSVHSQVIEDDDNTGGGVASQVYNNSVHDIFAGVLMLLCDGDSVYNNVIWNNKNNANILVGGGCGTSGSSTTTNIYNNTIDCSNGLACFAVDSKNSILGTVVMRNNIWITNGNALWSMGKIGNLVNTNNYTMPTAEANQYGFVSSRKYAPSSSDPHVAGQGLNVMSLVPAALASILGNLSYDVQGAPWFGGSYVARGANWDLGAYASAGQSPSSSSAPTAPKNLLATVQ